MASGYRNRPVEEAAAFVGGWYRTGDVGRLDRDGCLYILGRAGDLAAVDGTAVTPAAMADTLCGVATVRYAVVVPDERAGAWVAAVEAWPGGVVDERACREAVAEAHGPGTAAALVMVPIDAVPLTEQGKPDRAAIRVLGPRVAA
jgi:fatty-acyl-CoA synthase